MAAPHDQGYDSRAVANYLLDEARQSGLTLTPMQLLKLVYIAHGWSLALWGKPLISDAIEAWDYGPVIPRLYHAIKHFGRGEIDEPIQTLKIPKGGFINIVFGEEETVEFRAEFTDLEKELLKKVLRVYGGLKAFQLSALTHKGGTPWGIVTEGSGNVFGVPIANHLIQQHFETLAAENVQRAAG